MSKQNAAEQELAQLIIEALDLEDIAAEDIDPEDALFGDGLGLDSIDALEISLAVSQKYGVQIKSGDENNKQIFASLRALSAHIENNQAG